MKNKGLVNYWSFDNCLLDFIGGKNMVMGQYASFTNDRNEIVSSALDLNRGYVQAPEGIYFHGDFTITAWVVLRSVSQWARILDFGNGTTSDNILLIFCRDQSSIVEVSVYSRNVQDISTFTNESLILNKWNFVSAVVKDKTAKIYYNGTLKASGGIMIPRNVTRVKNYIGKSNWVSNQNADGKVDELKFFNRALNETEILNEMNENLGL